MSMVNKVWGLLPTLTLFYICTLLWFGSEVAAAGFVLREGDFRTTQGGISDTKNDTMTCFSPSEILNIIFMTSTPKANPQDLQLANLSGRCLHSLPVQLLDAGNNSTVMSFSTTFTFALTPRNSTSGESIDGLAFIIVPALSLPPDHSYSGYLGLLNASTNNNSSNHAFAVEFDSFPNSEFNDLLEDHVGIDINMMNSMNSSRAGYYSAECSDDDDLNFNPMTLKDGSTIQAWIDYNASTHDVSVTVSSLLGFKPRIPLLETRVDLSGVILEDMYVGFSSSTGPIGGFGYVFAWSFNINGSADPLYRETFPHGADMCSGSRKRNIALILEISMPIAVVAIALMAAAVGACYLRGVKKNLRDQFHDLVELEHLDYRPKKYSYKELSAATEGFNSNQLLGSGAFGSVYKGILPASGGSVLPTVVAVKRIAPNSMQGRLDYLVEVDIIGRLRHRNLVQLLGWCHEKNELLLVYEYMSNGSLDQWLFKTKSSRDGVAPSTMSWNQRVHILRGVATALVYLHDEWKQVVLHRDVKASNVMVDSGFNAKLGDFGLARLHEHEAPEFQTSRTVAGTVGYLAPEAATQGMFTQKSDVYSFGILALEVASGRRPVNVKLPNEEIVLVSWVWDLYEEDKIMEAADDNLLTGSGSSSLDEKSKAEIAVVLQVGLLCCHPDPDIRPSMGQVLQMLTGEVPLPQLAAWPGRTKSMGPDSISFSFGHNHYQWNDHSVELGMIENSEEIKLIPQFQSSSTAFSSQEMSAYPPVSR